jgi:hypothetical protein
MSEVEQDKAGYATADAGASLTAVPVGGAGLQPAAAVGERQKLSSGRPVPTKQRKPPKPRPALSLTVAEHPITPLASPASDMGNGGMAVRAGSCASHPASGGAGACGGVADGPAQLAVGSGMAPAVSLVPGSGQDLVGGPMGAGSGAAASVGFNTQHWQQPPPQQSGSARSQGPNVNGGVGVAADVPQPSYSTSTGPAPSVSVPSQQQQQQSGSWPPHPAPILAPCSSGAPVSLEPQSHMQPQSHLLQGGVSTAPQPLHAGASEAPGGLPPPQPAYYPPPYHSYPHHPDPAPGWHSNPPPQVSAAGAHHQPLLYPPQTAVSAAWMPQAWPYLPNIWHTAVWPEAQVPIPPARVAITDPTTLAQHYPYISRPLTDAGPAQVSTGLNMTTNGELAGGAAPTAASAGHGAHQAYTPQSHPPASMPAGVLKTAGDSVSGVGPASATGPTAQAVQARPQAGALLTHPPELLLPAAPDQGGPTAATRHPLHLTWSDVQDERLRSMPSSSVRSLRFLPALLGGAGGGGGGWGLPARPLPPLRAGEGRLVLGATNLSGAVRGVLTLHPCVAAWFAESEATWLGGLSEEDAEELVDHPEKQVRLVGGYQRE